MKSKLREILIRKFTIKLIQNRLLKKTSLHSTSFIYKIEFVVYIANDVEKYFAINIVFAHFFFSCDK